MLSVCLCLSVCLSWLWALQSWLNQSRCHLVGHLHEPREPCLRWEPRNQDVPMGRDTLGRHVPNTFWTADASSLHPHWTSPLECSRWLGVTAINVVQLVTICCNTACYLATIGIYECNHNLCHCCDPKGLTQTCFVRQYIILYCCIV